jgi:hypothetical protein
LEKVMGSKALSGCIFELAYDVRVDRHSPSTHEALGGSESTGGLHQPQGMAICRFFDYALPYFEM